MQIVQGFHNGSQRKGLCAGRDLLFFTQQLKPNNELKVQINNQKPIRIPFSPNKSTAMQTAEP